MPLDCLRIHLNHLLNYLKRKHRSNRRTTTLFRKPNPVRIAHLRQDHFRPCLPIVVNRLLKRLSHLLYHFQIFRILPSLSQSILLSILLRRLSSTICKILWHLPSELLTSLSSLIHRHLCSNLRNRNSTCRASPRC